MSAPVPFRIGQGFDVHAFGDGDHVMLGGVRIAHPRGLVAHSDGDVLLHALADALLGALALGDIGQHFPPGDPAWRGVESRVLVRAAMRQVSAAGYRVGNVDATVLAERPKLAPHAPEMRAVIASDLDCTIEQISLKATTTERLGFVGREEGIAAMAVVLLYAGDPSKSSR